MVATTMTDDKCSRAKVAPETRERQVERRLKLQDDIQAGQEKIWEIIEDIAKEHGRYVCSIYLALLVSPNDRATSYVQRALHLGGKLLRKKRKTSSWNAFIHVKMKELNDGIQTFLLRHFLVIERVYTGVHEGGRTNVREYLKGHSSTLYQEYVNMTDEAKEELVKEYIKEKEGRRIATRVSARSAQKDVQTTFGMIEDEVRSW
jgi:hypothetical protein